MKEQKRAVPASLGVLAYLVLGACGTTLLGAVIPACAATLRNVNERVFSFAPGGDVVVESTNGRIVVEAWDRPQVRVQITREVRAGDDELARDLMRELQADVSVHPTEIRIESVYPKQRKVKGLWDWIGRGVRSTNIHYYLQVPRSTSLDLTTSNGEVRIRSIEGRVEASTTNGDGDVSHVRGTLEARTTNGAVRLVRIEGPADAATTNGSVSAQLMSLPSRGAMRLETTNGNVSGNVSATSSCRKDRTVRFAYVNTTTDVVTPLAETVVTGSNGDYSVVLPKPTDAGPATVVVRATVDQVFRKVGSKKKGKKDKKGRQFDCLTTTADSSPLTIAEPTPAP